MNNNEVALPQPRYLWFLILSYCMAMVFSNWFDVRLIRLFFLNTDAGTLIFPLTFIISDLITEVYGYQQARRAIWCGFLFNIFFIIYGQLIIHLPSPDYAILTNAKFNEMMAMNVRIIIASGISYFCSEPLNSYIMAKLKIHFAGHKLALRFVTSTFIASAVDSFIFGTLAFVGMMELRDLMMLIITMWALKVIIEIIMLPLSIYLTKKLKIAEGLDIYDTHTTFNIFSLNVDYTKKDNQF